MVSSREKKAKIIEQIENSLSRASICILADYRGLTASDMNDLRRRLREAGIELRVVKNTLARLAAERASKSELTKLLEGPLAIAFGFGEVTVPAKVLAEYSQAQKTLQIKGGLLGDRLLSVRDVAELVALPSREVLVARVIGGIQAPIVSLVIYLNSPVRGLMAVLQARIKQMEVK